MSTEQDQFEVWARDHLGQGYSLELDEGSYADRVTRWAFIAWKAGRASLSAPESAPLLADLAKLRAFVEDVIGEWPDVGGLDGFDLQALGTKHGILEMTKKIAPCREETCRCAEYETGEVECFSITSVLRPPPPRVALEKPFTDTQVQGADSTMGGL